MPFILKYTLTSPKVRLKLWLRSAILTLLHSERPKLSVVLTILSAIGLSKIHLFICTLSTIYIVNVKTVVFLISKSSYGSSELQAPNPLVTHLCKHGV